MISGMAHRHPEGENNRLAVYAAHTEPVYESCKARAPTARASRLYAVHGGASGNLALRRGASQDVPVRIPHSSPYSGSREVRPDRGSYLAGLPPACTAYPPPGTSV